MTTTNYDAKGIKTFLEIYFFERIRIVRFIVNFLSIFVIIMFFNENKYIHIDMFMFVLALFCIIEVNTVIIPNLNYLRLVKKNDKILSTKITYQFRENNFKYKLKEDNTLDYSDLKKVINTSNYYYLYLTSNHVLIVDKSNLDSEDIANLDKIFKDKASIYKYKKYV